MENRNTEREKKCQQHSLELNDFAGCDVKCKVCTASANGRAYKCNNCDIVLHRACLLQKSLITSPLHENRKHPLTLLLLHNTEVVKGQKCKVCNKQFAGILYRCGHSRCNYNVHPDCAQSSDPLIDHYIHTRERNHNLKLIICSTASNDSFQCDACKDTGCTGHRYDCQKCKVSVHEACAFSERFLTCFLHAKHSLELMKEQKRNRECNFCCKPVLGRSYICNDSSCKFYLHPSCAKIPQFTNDDVHRGHPLWLIQTDPKETPARPPMCKGCNRAFNVKEWYYRCKECQYNWHRGCLKGTTHVHGQLTSDEGAIQGGRQQRSGQVGGQTSDEGAIQGGGQQRSGQVGGQTSDEGAIQEGGQQRSGQVGGQTIDHSATDQVGGQRTNQRNTFQVITNLGVRLTFQLVLYYIDSPSGLRSAVDEFLTPS